MTRRHLLDLEHLHVERAKQVERFVPEVDRYQPYISGRGSWGRVMTLALIPTVPLLFKLLYP